MYLYIIGHEADEGCGCIHGPVKVGIANDPADRLKALQTGNPKKLRLLLSMFTTNQEMALLSERRVHEFMADYRMAGEWFDLTPMSAIHAFAIVALTCVDCNIVHVEEFSNLTRHSERGHSHEHEEAVQ